MLARSDESFTADRLARRVPAAAPSHVCQAAALFVLSLPLVALVATADAVRRAVRWAHASWARRLLFRIGLVPASALALAAAVIVDHVYFNRDGMPDLDPFVRFRQPTIGQVYDANGEVLIELAREYRRLVEYRDVPDVLQQAILAAEDKNFFEHGGVDYFAIPRVLVKIAAHSLAAARQSPKDEPDAGDVLVFPQGGSTLTQQLVRGYFLQHYTTRENGHELLKDTWPLRGMARLLGEPAINKLVRKVEEIRLSLWLEEELSGRFGSRRRAKEEILARYASFVYLGNGRYGFATASEYYLGRPLASLGPSDAADAALLAGITKSPGVYAPSPTNVDAPRRRRDEILTLMVRRGFLTREAARRAQRSPVRLAARSKAKTEAPAAVESVFAEIKARGDDRMKIEAFFDGRLHVHSTVDNRVQRVVNQALENGLRRYEERHPDSRGLIQGSVVVLHNSDARILAEAGGRQVFRDRYTSYSDYNRVTQSRRQPGSALKPVVYLTAFRRGSGLETEIWDSPVSVGMGGGRPPKWISNYDHKFKGRIPIRQALAESRNAATIWLTKQVGIEHVITTARELGIRTPLQPYITTALGASEVDLLELANVYRAMASGRLAEPHVIDRVTDGSGNVLFEHPHPSRSMAGSRAQLARIQEGLRGVVRIPGGTAHSLEKGADFPIPVMGKTGTTSDFRDALFVGSTFGPDGITVAVRIGFDDNRELGDRETGGRTALPVFREVMLGVYQRQLLGPPPPFPEGMEQRIAHYVEDRARRLLAASEEASPTPEDGAPPDVLPTHAVGDAVLAASQEAGQPVPLSLAGEETQAAGEPVAGGSGGTTERPGPPTRRPKSE